MFSLVSAEKLSALTPIDYRSSAQQVQIKQDVMQTSINSSWAELRKLIICSSGLV